jgi:hypothetical protein
MNHDFDTFVKEHLQDVLCMIEKEYALAAIRKSYSNSRKRKEVDLTSQLCFPETQLQDCAISPSFSHNHL